MNSTDSVYRRNSFSESDFQTAGHAIGVALVENGPEFCLRIAAKACNAAISYVQKNVLEPVKT